MRLRRKLPRSQISLKICYVFDINDILNIVRRRSEMTHQHRLSLSGSRVIERAVGEWRHRPPLAFMLQEDILSTCCNTDNVM